MAEFNNRTVIAEFFDRKKAKFNDGRKSHFTPKRGIIKSKIFESITGTVFNSNIESSQRTLETKLDLLSVPPDSHKVLKSSTETSEGTSEPKLDLISSPSDSHTMLNSNTESSEDTSEPKLDLISSPPDSHDRRKFHLTPKRGMIKSKIFESIIETVLNLNIESSQRTSDPKLDLLSIPPDSHEALKSSIKTSEGTSEPKLDLISSSSDSHTMLNSNIESSEGTSEPNLDMISRPPDSHTVLKSTTRPLEHSHPDEGVSDPKKVLQFEKRILVHSANMERILQYCSLYPEDHEFGVNEMIRTWVLEGLCQFIGEKEMKLYFEALLLGSVIQYSGVDILTGQARFKLNQFIIHESRSNLLHLQKPTTKQMSKQQVRDRVPQITINTESFPLQNLKQLDLSNTRIKELPKPIRKLVCLEYLDISRTPLKILPDSVCSLHNLKTLILLNCRELAALPKGMNKLSKLRHLRLDIASLLTSMPPGLGELTKLKTLPAFVVGKENGCHIVELKNLVNLKGTLRILKLENIGNSEEAKQVALHNKQHLQKLELQWSELQNEFDVLEDLQPPPDLKELQIVGYGGKRFPSWIGDPISNLVTITVHYCQNCELLPALGRLPRLKSLSISEMHAVKIIDLKFCGRMSTETLETGDVEHEVISQNLSEGSTFNAFPMLENLKLNGFPELESWTGLEEGDFPILHKLHISGCPKLTYLPELSLLKSLSQLAISVCPVLQSSPSKGLPASLENLLIISCPLLKESFCLEEAQDEQKVGHIPNIWIDHQQISPVNEANL